MVVRCAAKPFRLTRGAISKITASESLVYAMVNCLTLFSSRTDSGDPGRLAHIEQYAVRVEAVSWQREEKIAKPNDRRRFGGTRARNRRAEHRSGIRHALTAKISSTFGAQAH
jgi:hypothetical protein